LRARAHRDRVEFIPTMSVSHHRLVANLLLGEVVANLNRRRRDYHLLIVRDKLIRE